MEHNQFTPHEVVYPPKDPRAQAPIGDNTNTQQAPVDKEREASIAPSN